MTILSAAEFRKNTSKTLNRVAYGKERILLGRRGEPVAALVSLEDLALLERLVEENEDRADLEAARKSLEEPGANVPLGEVKRRLGV
mgnify:FL=1